MNRTQLVEKIMQTENELRTAGPIHKRDLSKHLRRMRAELAEYDRFQAAARRRVV